MALLSGGEKLELEMLIKGYYVHNGLPLMYITYIDAAAALVLVQQGGLTLKELQHQRARLTGAPLSRWKLNPRPGTYLEVNIERQVSATACCT